MALRDVLSGATSLARSLLTPTLAVDVVAITGAGFIPLFPAARPLQANVIELAELMEHPLETGAKITDHIIFRPIEIELPLLCVGEIAYRSTYAALRATYLAGTLLTIQTRTGSYPNMVISDLPHEETPDMFDGVAIRLQLREARFVQPKTELASSQVKNPTQASTINKGTQQTSTPNTAAAGKAASAASGSAQGAQPQGSTLYRWAYGS